jgi:hypothetical protein
MTAPEVDWKISAGNILQAIVLLAGLAAAYGQFSAKADSLAVTVDQTRRQTTRIEHYLSTQDKDYWRKTAENGDSGDR